MFRINILTINKIITIVMLSALIGRGMDEDTYTEITPFLIGKGDLAGAGDEGIHQQNIIITNTDEWIELKNKMDTVNNVTSGFTETEIDFSNYMIVAAFDSVRPSGGYSIEIKYIMENSCCITSTIENIIPNGFVTADFNQPFHIVKIPKSNKQIVFN